MRFSKQVLSNSGWVVLFAVLAARVWWASTTTSSNERLDYDDWPDGDTSDKDYWRSGVFLGVAADRIREVGLWRGDHRNAKSVHFFVSIPMGQREFERRLREWQARPDFDFQRFDDMFSAVPPHLPDWFPRPQPAAYVGAITDDSNWRVQIFRQPGDDHLYLRL